MNRVTVKQTEKWVDRGLFDSPYHLTIENNGILEWSNGVDVDHYSQTWIHSFYALGNGLSNGNSKGIRHSTFKVPTPINGEEML